MVLEFSKPSGFPFRPLYNFYFRNILPFFGRLFSKDKAAYRYLPDSVMKFPDNEEFLKLLDQAGFSDTQSDKTDRWCGKYLYRNQIINAIIGIQTSLLSCIAKSKISKKVEKKNCIYIVLLSFFF